MNDRETKAANAFKQRSLGRILVDFLETRRSGMSDSTCLNRHDVQPWVEFKALEAWPKRTSTCQWRAVSSLDKSLSFGSGSAGVVEASSWQKSGPTGCF